MSGVGIEHQYELQYCLADLFGGNDICMVENSAYTCVTY